MADRVRVLFLQRLESATPIVRTKSSNTFELVPMLSLPVRFRSVIAVRMAS